MYFGREEIEFRSHILFVQVEDFVPLGEATSYFVADIPSSFGPGHCSYFVDDIPSAAAAAGRL